MGKRGRQSQAAPAAKAAKKAVLDTYPGACSSVLAVLQEADLPESCYEMLQAALPLSLRTAKTERHTYEASVVRAVDDALTVVEAKKRAAVAAVEATIVAAAARQGTVGTELATAEARAAAAKQGNDAQNAVYKDTEEALSASKTALDAEQATVLSLAKELEKREAEKEVFDKVLSEQLEPLKLGDFLGNQWRLRNKLADQLMVHVSPLGLDVSLAEALPLSLKTKVGERGSFCLQVLEHAEALIKKHITSLSERIASSDAEKAEQARAVEAAETAVAAATEKWKASMDESVAAENVWLDERTAVANAESSLRELAEEVANSTEMLEDEKAALASFLEVGVAFAGLRDDGPDALKPKEPEPVVEDEAPRIERDTTQANIDSLFSCQVAPVADVPLDAPMDTADAVVA